MTTETKRTSGKATVFEHNEMKYLVIVRKRGRRGEERALFTFLCPAKSESVLWPELAGIAASRLGTRYRFIEGGGRVKVNKGKKVVRVYDTANTFGAACKEHVRPLFQLAMIAEGLRDFRLEVYNTVPASRARQTPLRDSRMFRGA